ncbi:Quinone oxidoreductase protein [Globisporangium polare]
MWQQQPPAPTPATFKAYFYTSFGVPEKELKLRTDVAQSAPIGATQPTAPTEDAPFPFGFDAAGTVVELGSDAHGAGFKVGDAVYTMMPFSGFGSVAEYIAVDAKFVAPKPRSLDFDQAAGVPLVGLTSYQALVKYANVQAGERVLILGGSSGTGIFAVQIAKALGAAHVITTTSFRNTEFVKSLGADQVIDYTKENWGEVVEPHSIDVIYDCGFEPNAWNNDAQKVLKKDTGRFVTLMPVTEPIESPIGAERTHMRVEASAADLKVLTKWIESGEIQTFVDSVHPFEDVLEALNRVKSWRARGKVVVHVATTTEAP